MKRTLPYFSHYNDTRTTIPGKALLNKYGIEGYGRYMILLEIIASCTDAKLDMNLDAAKSAVAHELQLNTESSQVFIDFLSSRNECGFLSYKDGILENDLIRENYNTVKAERNRKRESYKERVNAPNESSMEDCASGPETARKNADDAQKENKQIDKQIEIEKGGICGKGLGTDSKIDSLATGGSGTAVNTKTSTNFFNSDRMATGSKRFDTTKMTRNHDCDNWKYCPDCGEVLIYFKVAGGQDEYGCKKCRCFWIKDKDSGKLEKHGESLSGDSEFLVKTLLGGDVPQQLRNDLLHYQGHDDQDQ